MEDGMGVIAYDQVGSCYSDGIEGRRQYFDSIDKLSDDLMTFVNGTRGKRVGRKFWWGGRLSQYSKRAED